MTGVEVVPVAVIEDQQEQEVRTIDVALFPEVGAKVAKANARAERLGVPARLRVEEVARRVEQEKEWGIVLREREVVDYRVVGETIVLPGGWVFLASLQHGAGEGVEGANILRRAPGQADEVEIPDWARTVGPRCDHCGHSRSRRDTYLVVNAEGEVKQVGSSCLKDFLGVEAAHVGWVFGPADKAGVDSLDGPRQEADIKLDTFLWVVAVLVRTEGWVSKGQERDSYGERIATASWASNAFGSSPAARKDFARIREAAIEADKTTADEALAWARSEEFDVDGDYGWNLRVATKANGVVYRNLGLVASLVPTWLRKQERLVKASVRREQAANAGHVGKVGDKVVLDLLITKVDHFDGTYGLRTLVKAVTPEGAEVTCWTSPSTALGLLARDNLGTGVPVKVKATVKAHEDYKGVPQTVITRAKAA